jgi:hypothetical protein
VERLQLIVVGDREDSQLCRAPSRYIGNSEKGARAGVPQRREHWVFCDALILSLYGLRYPPVHRLNPRLKLLYTHVTSE